MKPISSSATCSVAPEVAFNKILSKEGFLAWWIGKVTIEHIDPHWPAHGSTMHWKAGGGIFKAEVIANNKPVKLEMIVRTPTANSTIIHAFEQMSDGKTQYTKTVIPQWRSLPGKIFGIMFVPILRNLVAKEVVKGASFAEQK